MREKLTDEVLTATQNRYNTPENCDCLTSTKVNHLTWDLVKGLVPIVSVIEKFVKARDKIP